MTIPEGFLDSLTKNVWDTALPILLIVVITLVLLKLARLGVHGVVKTLLDRETFEGTAQELSAVEVKKRMDTLEGLGVTVVRIFIVAIAALMVLGELNLNIGPAIAGLGVVGIAVGFGTQSIVRDYFTGALILIENQYSKGDVVNIAGVSGTVEDFSLRRTTLRDVDGVVHTVPNGEIKVASNMTRVWARINQDVTVAYGTDLEKAIAVIDEVGRDMYADPEWRRRIMEAPHVARVGQLGEYGVSLRVQGMVRAPEQWAAGGELRKRLLAAFAAHGIEIPRPQRVVLAKEPAPDPFDQGGPTDDELSAGTD